MHSFIRLFAFACIVLSAVAAPGDRVALVIGNGAYQYGNKLANPVNDATDIAASLKACGFSLVGDGPVTDLSHEALSAKIAQFKKASAEAKVALFFFAGHAMEVDGANYLMPVDAKIEEKYQVRHRTLALDEVLESMAGEDRLKIVILDCCRNNPVARSWGRSANGGLAIPASTPGGTVLFFATAPGKTAEDGTGRNSPFSEVLKDALKTPGSDLDSVFKSVGTTVKKKTSTQEPWMNSSYYGRFLFSQENVPASDSVLQGKPAGVPSSAKQPMSPDELSFWVKKLKLTSHDIGSKHGHRIVFRCRVNDALSGISISLYGFDQPLLINGSRIGFRFYPLQPSAVVWKQSDQKINFELKDNEQNLKWKPDAAHGITQGFMPKGAGAEVASFPKDFFFRVTKVDSSKFDPTKPAAVLIWKIPTHKALGTSIENAKPDPDWGDGEEVIGEFIFLDLIK